MQRKSSRKVNFSTDAEVRDALFEFVIFIFFLILTTFVVLSVRDPYMFYLNKTVDSLFVARDITIAPGVTINYKHLVTVNDFWDYMFFGFLGVLHGGLAPDLEQPKEPPEEHTNESNTTKPAPGADKIMEPADTKKHRKRANEHLDGDDIDLGGNVPNFGNFYDDGAKRHKRVKRKGVGGGGGGSAGGGQVASSALNLIGRIFILENMLLGPPRVRQIRVKKDSCYVNDAFIRYFNTCYAEYSSGKEEKSEKWLSTSFKTLSDVEATSIWASIARYQGAGYVQLLTYDREKNNNILTGLQNEHWIDRGTRLVVVEWNMYNENLDIFQSNKLIVEVPPTGGVLTSAQIYSVRESSFFTNPNIIVTGVIIAFYIMVIYYTLKGLNDIRKMGCRRFFKSLLNILDTIILIFAYLAIGYNIWHMFYIAGISKKIDRENEFHSLDSLVQCNTIYVDMMALLCFFVWIKIFKFISFNKTLVQFTTTLKRCSKDLAGFSLMFLIVFLAYAQLGLLLFGTKHPDFRNFLTSVLTMIRMILGDFQYDLIEEANRVLGPIYFLTYILLVFFILLNMFLAIIMETYSSVKAEITHGRSNLGTYLLKKIKHLFYCIRYCGRIPAATLRRINATTEEDPEQAGVSGKPDEITDAPGQSSGRGYHPSGQGVSDKEFNRLSNRVGLLEDMLEQLVTNMDRILKRVEQKRKKE